MTTATETAPQDLTYWVNTDEHLARNMAAALHNFAYMVEAFPDVAPLLRVMLGNLTNPVDVTDSHAALERLISVAWQSAGVDVSDAELGGAIFSFGPAVKMWAPPFTLPEAEAAIEAVPESPVVEAADVETLAAPDAHDKIPEDPDPDPTPEPPAGSGLDETQAMEIPADDADVPAKTVTEVIA